MHFAAGVLPCGRVIVAGGVIPDVQQSKQGEAINQAEIYDPVHNRWTEIAPLPQECRAATGGWLTSEGRFAVYGLGPAPPDVAVDMVSDDDEDESVVAAERLRSCCAYNVEEDIWEPIWEVSFLKERGQECSMATGVNVRSSFVITGGFKRAPAGNAAAGADAAPTAAPYPPGSSRLTCAELFDEETQQSFMLPYDRTTPRERLFSTLWPTSFGGDTFREKQDAALVSKNDEFCIRKQGTL